MSQQRTQLPHPGSHQLPQFPFSQPIENVQAQPVSHHFGHESCPEEALPADPALHGGAQAGGSHIPYDAGLGGADPGRLETGMRALHIPSSLIKNIEDDYAQRALVGMIFGPRPPVDTLRAWIRANWETAGIEVAQTQALRNNTYIFLMKTPAMALQAISAGQWMIKNSPLCLFKWFPGFKPKGGNQVKYPIWVEFPDLPFQYYPLLKSLAEPLGKVLGIRPVSDINPRWHPQVLVELDLAEELPKAWRLIRDDGIEFSQDIFYKHLPNACFHCGVQGHMIKECPRRAAPTKASSPMKTGEKGSTGKLGGTPNPPKERQGDQVSGKKKSPPAKKPNFHTKNQYALLDRLEDGVDDAVLEKALALYNNPPIVDPERIEDELETLESQVNCSLAEEQIGKGSAAPEGPDNMEVQKDNKRPSQNRQVTPDKTPKDKRDKKKHFR